MKKEQLVFLVVGVAFGFLAGIGAYNVWFTTPHLHADAAAPGAIVGPQGPPSATMGGPAPAVGGDGAPMVARINELKRRVQDDPTDLPALVELANLHHDVGMWPQAIGWYEQALALSPDDPDLMTDLGICYRGTGEYARALELFARANAERPGHWQSLFNAVIVAAFDLEDWERARRDLAELEKIEPAPPQVGQLRAEVERRAAAAGAGGAS